MISDGKKVEDLCPDTSKATFYDGCESPTATVGQNCSFLDHL